MGWWCGSFRFPIGDWFYNTSILVVLVYPVRLHLKKKVPVRRLCSLSSSGEN